MSPRFPLTICLRGRLPLLLSPKTTASRFQQVTVLRLLLLIASSVFLLHTPSEAEDLESAIQYLLNHVEHSNVVFIRNNREHTPAEAAAHMKRKYAHFKEEIRTPEDFIRLTGTRSLVTGREYQIRRKDGSIMPAGKWLEDVLADYRHERR